MSSNIFLDGKSYKITGVHIRYSDNTNYDDGKKCNHCGYCDENPRNFCTQCGYPLT